MAVQQKQKKPTPRSFRLTVADWGLMAVHLILGVYCATLFPSLLRYLHANDLRQALSIAAISLATLGYLGASLTLLLRLRRAAAVLELLCTLAWWCGAAFFRLHILWSISSVHKPPVMLVSLGVMALIGIFHLTLAWWLWRFRCEEE